MKYEHLDIGGVGTVVRDLLQASALTTSATWNKKLMAGLLETQGCRDQWHFLEGGSPLVRG